MKKEKQKELIDKYPKFFERIGPIGFHCRDGWFNILDEILGCIYKYCEDNKHSPIYGKSIIDNEFVFPSITTIKEKFGSLDIYTDSSDELIRGMIAVASYLSRKTCEFCGRKINVGRTHGPWIYTVCEVCREKEPRVKELEWTPSTDQYFD